jgi:phosphatidylinositol 4-kinase
MELVEKDDLLLEINSEGFNCFQCIRYLMIHRNNIGIQHVLVQKLYKYTYDDLEFFIPQFVQLLIAFESDSMALEEFLLDNCARFPHFSLIVFWNIQSSIFELRDDPESYSFQTARKFINKLQNILFNPDIPQRPKHEFRENLQPAIIMAGAIAASFGVPEIHQYCSPLIKSQSKQQKSLVFKLANFHKTLTKNLTMKNTRLSAEHSTSVSDDENMVANRPPNFQPRSEPVSRLSSKKVSLSLLSDESEFYTTDDEQEPRAASGLLKVFTTSDLISEKTIVDRMERVEENLNINTVIKSRRAQSIKDAEVSSAIELYNINSQSLPDLSKLEHRPRLYPTESETSLNFPHSSIEENFKTAATMPNLTTLDTLINRLQAHYSKSVTSFIIALQNVSLRLSQVPKEARLSALRAELSIINETLLPSEIDIPQLFPVTSNKNKKYHKILRLSINEACVLNSAERVPFLLSIEYLSDEFDFNPFSDYNQKLLNTLCDNGVKDANNSLSKLQISMPNGVVDIVQKESIPGKSVHLEADLGDRTMLSHRSSREFSSVIGSDSDENSIHERNITSSPVVGADNSTTALASQMRIASVMLQQLESSGQATSEQSIAIKARIVESMIALQDQFDSINYEKLNELKGDNPDAGERKLENDFKLGEDWNAKKQRIRKSSVYGHLPNWDLCSVIVKNGDDLPQEAFATQLISMITNIWKSNDIGAWTRRMKILITSANTGLVETITNAISIHSIKKSLTEISIKNGENSRGRIFTLQDYFRKMFGDVNSNKYNRAQANFAKSLASYSIICYVLQIKDRHNGNIMVDDEGHIVHIDFGFLLSNSPGSVGFEAAPFKLTTEYVDLLGGLNSRHYVTFKELCKSCFNVLRKNCDQLVSIVQLMQKDSSLPCFKNGETTSVLLKQRLQTHLTDQESDAFVENVLIGKSLGSMYTRLYDQFQMVTQGIYN